jgi:amidase
VDKLAWLDATTLTEMVRRSEISPIELTEAAIERIRLVNPVINAVVTPLFDRGMVDTHNTPSGSPFEGVPFLLKDLLAAYAGVPLSAGSSFLRDFIPTYDSEIVHRYKKAGLIIIGKTNTSEFGILGTTEPELFGPTRNPWDVGRSTGGSSGGAAAAVASGLVPMAHGSDAAGSLRIPASCCGVFGLKPTRARNSLAPDYGDLVSGLWVEHAITRSVRDSALLLDATSGPAAGDPYRAPQPRNSFRHEAGRNPGQLRIALTTTSPTGTSVDSVCIHAALDAAELCSELGHQVTEIALGVDPERLSSAFEVIWAAGTAWTVAHWKRVLRRAPRREDFEPITRMLNQIGQRTTAVEYLEAVCDLQQLSRGIVHELGKYDIWLTPTVATLPPPLGWIQSPLDDPMLGYERDSVFCAFTAIPNITGQPAMSVPLFWTSDGLPIGTQFVAEPGGEHLLIRLASQLEEARPWADRHPPTVETLYRNGSPRTHDR